MNKNVRWLTYFLALILLSGTIDSRHCYSGQKSGSTFSLIALEKEPKNGREILSDEKLDALKKDMNKNPKDRGKRLLLIRSLMISGKLQEALSEAITWREIDAYNLVVIRLLGDIYSEMGETAKAKRVYSAVIELVPKSAQANRALSTVLKQSGDLATAYERLLAASIAQPDDQRLQFERADIAQRLGKNKVAGDIFNQIINSSNVQEEISYPAKQRLAQILTASKRDHLQNGNTEEAQSISEKIDALKLKGGAVNDIKIYLSWDTNGSDVDLWVINPAGQKINYKKKRGKYGGELFHDVTSGYGPESFTASKTVKGTYLVQVHYYSTSNSSAFKEARGEVIVLLEEGTKDEARHVLPYRLFQPKQLVSVCKIMVADEEGN